MQDKIIEIIAYILGELKNSKQFEEINSRVLMDKGYSETEINSAFAWIFSKISRGEKILNSENKESQSRRFLHKDEKSILSTEAEGYIISMRELGILSDADEDTIMERILVSGFRKVGIIEIKYFVASLIFDIEGKSDILDRFALQNNETIN